jgi:hypothetical protein
MTSSINQSETIEAVPPRSASARPAPALAESPRPASPRPASPRPARLRRARAGHDLALLASDPTPLPWGVAALLIAALAGGLWLGIFRVLAALT